MSATLTHRGSCHCGAIAFEVDAPARLEVEACNCSICSKSAYLHLIVAASRLRVLRGADQLTSYSFNTGTARHTFCRTCGVKPFYVPRSNPSGYSVNVRCLERTHIADIAVEPFDGRDWERHAARLAGKAGEQEPGAGRG